MTATTGVWTAFDPTLPVLLHEYTFGPGRANALAVRGADGMIVVSPPGNAGEIANQIARIGDVKALVAPNAFHTMGIAPWKERFPDVPIFAPEQSIVRVERKSGQKDIRPLGELAPIAGPRLRFIDMPHYKTGEALVCIESARGLAWYVTDIIFNMRELPKHPVPRLAFRLAGSAPGLRFNNIAPLFMVADKRALRAWLAAEAARQKPRWIIASHGAVADLEIEVDAAKRLFGSMVR